MASEDRPLSLSGGVIVFTDLDGTLLDANYSFRAALPAIRLLQERAVPLIVVSSKTRTEIEHYRKLLKNDHPFVSENGGGILIPAGYFGPSHGGDSSSATPLPACEKDVYSLIAKKEGFVGIRLGAPYADLRGCLEGLRREGFAVKGFGDMTVSEIMRLTGLSRPEAEMARMRDFDEPFIFLGGKRREPELFRAIAARGFRVTRGRLLHLLGDSDKGRAVRILIELYRGQGRSVTTVALGDAENDMPMLEQVDVPILVRRPDGGYCRSRGLPVLRARGVGPRGWKRAIEELLAGDTASLHAETLQRKDETGKEEDEGEHQDVTENEGKG